MIERNVNPLITVQFRDKIKPGEISTNPIIRLLMSYDDTSDSEFNAFAENTMGFWFAHKQKHLDESVRDCILPGVTVVGAGVVGRLVEYKQDEVNNNYFLTDKITNEAIRSEKIVLFNTLFKTTVKEVTGLIFSIEQNLDENFNNGVFFPGESVRYLAVNTYKTSIDS